MCLPLLAFMPATVLLIAMGRWKSLALFCEGEGRHLSTCQGGLEVPAAVTVHDVAHKVLKQRGIISALVPDVPDEITPYPVIKDDAPEVIGHVVSF